MAIALRGIGPYAEQPASGGSSIDVYLPSGVQDGDILVLLIGSRTTTVPTLPGGWTTLRSKSATISSILGWRRASSEPSSYTATRGTDKATGAVILAYSGCLASGDPTDGSSVSSGSGSPGFSAGITTTADGDRVLFLIAQANQRTLSSWGGGFTEQLDTNGSTSNTTLGVADLAQGTHGAVGNQTVTVSGTGNWNTYQVALKPDSGGPAVVDGEAALSASGLLTTDGTCVKEGAAGPGGAASLAATATLVLLATATLLASSALDATGEVLSDGAAGLSASGVASGTGGLLPEGAAGLVGTGALAATGGVLAEGAAGPSASGAASGSGLVVAEGAAGVSAAGYLSASGQGFIDGAAGLPGAGSLSGSGEALPCGAAGLSGAGVLAAAGEAVRCGGAALAGSGSLSGAGEATVYAAATLPASGSLSARGTVVTYGGAGLAAAGGLTGPGEAITDGGGALAGMGAVTAAGGLRVGSYIVSVERSPVFAVFVSPEVEVPVSVERTVRRVLHAYPTG